MSARGRWHRRGRHRPGSFRRARHSAAASSDVPRSLVVTHPYHPLTGRRLAVLFAERKAGLRVFVGEDGGPERVRIPLGWTDLAPAPAGHRVAAEGLVALKVLVVALSAASDRRCARGQAPGSLEAEGMSMPVSSGEVRTRGAGRGPRRDRDGAGQHGARGAGGRGRQ
ncbi:DUF5372 family protein [Streptomyces sp. NPDC091217]|uniref:DUF5372 family protein n=1 Tax=Streptomyces sp. NPDC091217 TaxID=3365975 RepID=UPI0037FA0741